MSILRLAAALRLGVSAASPPSIRNSLKPNARASVLAQQRRATYATAAKPSSSIDLSQSSSIDEQEQQLRSHAAQWPARLPKPTVYSAAQRRQWQEEHSSRATLSDNKTSTSLSTAALLISSSPPEHGPSRKAGNDNDASRLFFFSSKNRAFSTSKAAYESLAKQGQQDRQWQWQQEWPSWLPPRPAPVPLPSLLARIAAWIRRNRFNIIITTGFIVVPWYALALEEAPFTGRKRFSNASEGMMEDLAQHGFAVTLATHQGKILPDEHPYAVRALAIANRILDAAQDLEVGGLDFKAVKGDTYARQIIRKTKWAMLIADHPAPYAFTCAGGQTFINTGMFEVMDSQLMVDAAFASSAGADDRIAAVVAHEVAHVLCQHHRELASRETFYFLASSWLAFVASPMILLFPRLADVFCLLPYSRINEHEADTLGLKLMARACFDVEEAVHAWQRMDFFGQIMRQNVEDDGAGYEGNDWLRCDGTLLSTHPPWPERIRRTLEGLPVALKIRKQSGCPDLETLRAFRRAVTAEENVGASATADSATTESASTSSNEQGSGLAAQEDTPSGPTGDAVVKRDMSSQSPPAPSP